MALDCKYPGAVAWGKNYPKPPGNGAEGYVEVKKP